MPHDRRWMNGCLAVCNSARRAHCDGARFRVRRHDGQRRLDQRPRPGVDWPAATEPKRSARSGGGWTRNAHVARRVNTSGRSFARPSKIVRDFEYSGWPVRCRTIAGAEERLMAWHQSREHPPARHHRLRFQAAESATRSARRGSQASVQHRVCRRPGPHHRLACQRRCRRPPVSRAVAPVGCRGTVS